MSSAVQTGPYPLDEYLRHEVAAGIRHEYVAGGVFAMAGASERHNRIAGNVYMRLRQQLRGSRCGVFISDMKLRIDRLAAVYYPDVMLVCDETDDAPLWKTAPCVVVEVLSPSTAATDRREKRAAYLSLPSLQAYVMADSESRSVEALVRGAQGFASHALGEDALLRLPCGGRELTIALDDVYEDVDGLAHAG